MTIFVTPFWKFLSVISKTAGINAANFEKLIAETLNLEVWHHVKIVSNPFLEKVVKQL